MSLSRFLLRSVVHYWRWHVGLLAGVALAAMVIAGSMLIGNAVKETLRHQSQVRLGKIDEAVSAGEGFFAQRVVEKIRATMPPETVAPVLLLRGTVAMPANSRRVNGVNVLGVDAAFWGLGRTAMPPPGGIAVNAALAEALQAAAGDEVVLRFEKPSLIARDAPLSGESDQTEVLSGPIAAVAGAETMGSFSLMAEQTPALNIFVPLQQLQQSAGQAGNVNLAVADRLQLPDKAPQGLLHAFRDPATWSPQDVGLNIDAPVANGHFRISTPRVFLADSVAGKITGGAGVLTYLCTEARGAAEHTAYPMISAVAPELGILPEGFPEDGILLNQWTADSLKLKTGDPVKVNYFTVTRARQLQEAEASFVVRGILPMDHPAVHAAWTPDFPGISEAANCRDWKPGIPMKTKGFIREADEAYWQQWKATPKAFISLKRGQQLWTNRFGSLTSLWLPKSVYRTEASAARHVQESVTLEDLGIALVEPAKLAQAAVDGSMNFGSLFLSMSIFLMVTAFLLAVLLFLFNLESRAAQVGLLRAVGLTGDRVRLVFLLESGIGAAAGVMLGAGLAVWYADFTLDRLEGDWAGAVAGMKFVRTVSVASLANGAAMTFCLVLLLVWAASRRLSKAEPHRLLSGASLGAAAARGSRRPRRRGFGFWLAMGCLVLAAGMVPAAASVPRDLQPGVFFGAATLLVLGGIFGISDWLRSLDMGAPSGRIRSAWHLGIRNAVRRRGRSLAVCGMLAAGIFLVVALNAFRREADTVRSRGTGGFALMGTADSPIYEDLTTASGADAYGLEAADLKEVDILPFRQREGEEASCLNLNKAQSPSILGVNVADAVRLAKFKFAGVAAAAPKVGNPWELLQADAWGPEIPVIADKNSALWALKVSLGDVIEIQDARGRPARLRLVAWLSDSILQGHLVLSESHFLRLFPDTPGYRVFLVNAPDARLEETQKTLTRQLQNRGLALESASGRLRRLQAVQNAYLGIFSALGGFGLLLSTLGLGLLVARNVLERRAEFGLLQACGFRRGQLRQVILGEHLPLFLAAFLVGTAAALLALWPHLRDGSAGLPLGWTAFLLTALASGGVFFCWLAAWLALRQPLIQSLRHE